MNMNDKEWKSKLPPNLLGNQPVCSPSIYDEEGKTPPLSENVLGQEAEKAGENAEQSENG